MKWVQSGHIRRLEDRTSCDGAATIAPRGVAGTARPLIQLLAGSLPLRVEFWDGSSLEPDDAALAANGGAPTLLVRSPDALRRVLWAPGELGIGRAYVSGELDCTGDLLTAVQTLRNQAGRERSLVERAPQVPSALTALWRLGLLRRPPPPPPEEARPRGRQHTKHRDAEAVGHHYDVGNDFYRLMLGKTMTYSCARFVSPNDSLETAQMAKIDLICRKLGLDEQPGMTLLDVGCGWGTLAMHAAEHYDARVIGITISQEQVQLAQQRVKEAGLADQVEIRLQDYRDLSGGPFHAISSVGMFEHVGHDRMAEYFATLRGHLRPQGRLLNHAVSSIGGHKPSRRSFTHRYVFPDGELIDVGQVALAMESAGFEVRDVESLREHYSRTVGCWVANLHQHWDEAVKLVGEARARVWLLYMTTARTEFDRAAMAIHQVLGVVPDADGNSAMPLTRRGWV